MKYPTIKNIEEDRIEEAIKNQLIQSEKGKTGLKIYKYPHPYLLRYSSDVDLDDPDIKDFINKMATFYKEGAEWGRYVGLAAPQVGYNYNIFIAQDVMYINPKILHIFKGQEQICQEGCYSLEDNKYDYEVTRPYGLILRWQDTGGFWNEKRFNGFNAQVIFHEYDHLLGKLCNGNA